MLLCKISQSRIHLGDLHDRYVITKKINANVSLTYKTFYVIDLFGELGITNSQ